MNAETSISQSIRIAAGRIGCALFRNTVGRFKTASGQWVVFGLAPGSADLIGWTCVTVTQSMIGKPVAIFTAIEVKVSGAYTEPERLKKQESFIAAVKKDGGYAGFAHNENEAYRIIRGI